MWSKKALIKDSGFITNISLLIMQSIPTKVVLRICELNLGANLEHCNPYDFAWKVACELEKSFLAVCFYCLYITMGNQSGISGTPIKWRQ